jgi:hypothetical protein
MVSSKKQTMSADTETVQVPDEVEKPVEKASKTDKKQSKQSKKDPGQPPKPKKTTPGKKRGPARPYKRLSQDTLDSRITKLQKRMDRAQTQAAETEGFLVKYKREQAFREKDAEEAAKAASE